MLKRLSLPGGLRLWITLLTLAFVGVALSAPPHASTAARAWRQLWHPRGTCLPP